MYKERNNDLQRRTSGTLNESKMRQEIERCWRSANGLPGHRRPRGVRDAAGPPSEGDVESGARAADSVDGLRLMPRVQLKSRLGRLSAFSEDRAPRRARRGRGDMIGSDVSARARSTRGRLPSAGASCAPTDACHADLMSPSIRTAPSRGCGLDCGGPAVDRRASRSATR